MNGIICGDSIQVLPMLPENSIDLIATDPPYGVEFMGQEWDAPDNLLARAIEDTKGPHVGKVSGGGFGTKSSKDMTLPQVQFGGNLRCENCGKWRWDWPGRPCECDDPKWPNMKAIQGRAFQSWVTMWASKCYRVLKPGAHMFVLALPRMYHRVAVAIEDAGFVLNSPLMWLFASGFPKALDISKAFDKRAFDEWLDTIPHGLTAAEKRKVLSAGVGGAYSEHGEISSDGVIREKSRNAAMFSGNESRPWRNAQLQGRHGEGARLLAAVVEEFWHGEGLPPGVRVKVGEEVVYGDGHIQRNRTARNKSGRTGFTMRDGIDPNPTISAPSTPLAQQWDGWKSPQLKPAMEMIVFASKPLSERTFADNVERWGTGGINVDAARIPTTPEMRLDAMQRQQVPHPIGWGSQVGEERLRYNARGRYPANVIAEEGCVLPTDRMRYFNLSLWAETHGICDTPKASRKEKEAGLEGLPLVPAGSLEGNNELLRDNATRVAGDGVTPVEFVRARNAHPTCKPLALMSWLIALGCPEDGLVLDPFMGTGTTLIGAHLGGMRGLGIEREWKWCDIANRRLAHWKAQPRQLGLGLDKRQQLCYIGFEDGNGKTDEANARSPRGDCARHS